MRKLCSILMALLFLFGAMQGKEPPIAASETHDFNIHDHELSDPWFWMKDRKDPRLTKALKAEEKYASESLKPSSKLAAKLYKEFSQRIPLMEESAFALKDGYFYYNRQSSKQDYPIYYRKADEPQAKEELLLDLNKMAKKHKFLDLGFMSVSPDNLMMAYSIDLSGDEVYTLWYKDLSSSAVWQSEIENISDFIWQADSQHAFIITENELWRSDKCYRLDTKTGKLTLLLEESDPAYNLGLYYWGDRSTIFLSSGSKTTSQIWYIASNDIQGSFQPTFGKKEHTDYSLAVMDETMYVYTDLYNPDYSIARCSIENLAMENWELLIDAEPGSTIESFSLFDDFIVLSKSSAGQDYISIHDKTSGMLIWQIAPEEPSDMGLWNNLDPHAEGFYYYQETWLKPFQIYYQSFSGTPKELYYTTPLPKAYDPSLYVAESTSYQAADGTAIPLTLIYKKDEAEGTKPLWLNGYGAYGDVEKPWFSRSRQSQLDRGVILAFAHVRGGGEMGKVWHDLGRLLHKKNSFTDFCDAVEYLIQSGISSPEQILIEGGSAGGLLVGAVTNMIPQKIKAVIADVPFVDLINTMLDPNLPLTVGEYEEWGDPQIPEQFEYMLSYSPYDNVSAQKYPDILITAGWMDYRVGYWESLKWAQKLRSLNAGKSRITYILQKEEGHSGSSSRIKGQKSYAKSMGWGLWELKIEK